MQPQTQEIHRNVEISGEGDFSPENLQCYSASNVLVFHFETTLCFICNLVLQICDIAFFFFKIKGKLSLLKDPNLKNNSHFKFFLLEIFVKKEGCSAHPFKILHKIALQSFMKLSGYRYIPCNADVTSRCSHERKEVKTFPGMVISINLARSCSKQVPTCNQCQKQLLRTTARIQSSSTEVDGYDPSLTQISVFLLTTAE